MYFEAYALSGFHEHPDILKNQISSQQGFGIWRCFNLLQYNIKLNQHHISSMISFWLMCVLYFVFSTFWSLLNLQR